ncbi:ABC transporter substrate-binding protein [Calidifontibacillus erzurumensis]|uniref:Iron-siderophore ABC transporter substrate-binding protein n=1 Tax=Calidifontibacillus erzurumensis TaxID=2741433 RepID=A0A8J8GAB5_9BACI|nr:iron-siderophore ABC transporter substrate-binding protein [Calidifontibacillus erzurumensis]NSL50235.1 iron-siderophore ABC transporter substrate-binding protein [Calidifontibacillus erzurumensis]
MLNKKVTFWIMALLCSLSLILAGCGAKDGKTSSKENKQKNEAPQTEKTTYTVKHAMGETTIEGTPEKIVILTNEGTEALLAMGVTPVGAVKSWLGDPWYPHIADQMEGVTEVGTESEPNLEAIAALQPDLIIGNKMRQEAVYEQLSAIAPTVFAETLRGDWKENFQLYAKAINKEEKGKEVLEAYENRINEFKEKAGDKLNQKVSIVRFTGGEVRIYQKDSFSGVILEEIGFARPESQDVNDFAIRGVTKEMIPQMDGDILFYFTYETGDGEASKIEQEWINDPLFQKLDVVQKGKVYKVDDAIWNTAGGVIAANLMIDDLEKYFLQ